jgi:hypothetical protein
MATGSFDYRLAPGKRLLICGKNGSGKSTFAYKYLDRSPYHWVLFNPKGTQAFSGLSDQKVLDHKITGALVEQAVRKYKYVNIKFPNGWSWEFQDALLRHLCEQFTNIGFLIDELYYIHASNGHAGTGLVGLLSRGRELRQTFIGLAQRPKFISKFIFSEMSYVAEFELQIAADRKIIYDEIGLPEALIRQRNYDFAFFDLETDRVTQYRVAA